MVHIEEVQKAQEYKKYKLEGKFKVPFQLYTLHQIKIKISPALLMF